MYTYKDQMGVELHEGDFVIIACSNFGTPYLKWGRIGDRTKTDLLRVRTAEPHRGNFTYGKSCFWHNPPMLKISSADIPEEVKIALIQGKES
jgi:hypothetical protein